MNRFIGVLVFFAMSISMTLSAQPYYYEDYTPPQGYQQSCAADCYPCDPCAITAPMCGLSCGLSVCSIAAAIAAVIGVAAIIVASPDSAHIHAPNL
ncbi:MAG: hypothetical protein JJU12_05455 [Chlamydiales bacterium]|nr:hypothetical protein [Chlamydiales bacterium]